MAGTIIHGAVSGTEAPGGEGVLWWVAYAATGVELLAVVIIVVVIVIATVLYLTKIVARQADRTT
jgi:hypothetical protein